eukprot:scaffold1621_cov150-Pinguiococcus_pyrenoidosus.AAC.5
MRISGPNGLLIFAKVAARVPMTALRSKMSQLRVEKATSSARGAFLTLSPWLQIVWCRRRVAVVPWPGPISVTVLLAAESAALVQRSARSTQCKTRAVRCAAIVLSSLLFPKRTMEASRGCKSGGARSVRPVDDLLGGGAQPARSLPSLVRFGLAEL